LIFLRPANDFSINAQSHNNETARASDTAFSRASKIFTHKILESKISTLLGSRNNPHIDYNFCLFLILRNRDHMAIKLLFHGGGLSQKKGGGEVGGVLPFHYIFPFGKAV
jgi:hypothetical protein